MNEIENYSQEDLRMIKAAWTKALEKGREAKAQFVSDGNEVMNYYAREHSSVYRDYVPNGFWQGATVPKTYEGVKVFGSFLHQQAPVRRVMGRSFNDPLSEVIEAYQRYSAREMDLRRHGRLGLEEALIKGMGLLHTEIDENTEIVRSRYESVDNYLKDPDSTNFEDSWWAAYRCREPKWAFKRRYGAAARDAKSDTDMVDKGNTRTDAWVGKTQDLVTYWKIYSKMGVGYRINSQGSAGEDEGTQDRLQDFKYIVLAPGVEHPVYIGDWPTPFWADTRGLGWPCSELVFARECNKPWPISPFKPALPLQKWIDWAYSFLLRKVATTSRDIIVLPERLGEKQKAVIRNDAVADLEIMYVDDAQMQDIKNVFQTIQFPQMNGDLLTAIQMAEQKFREVTGLHEILSGITSASYRSAEEARVKDRNSRSRVEDMNQEVEVWHSHAARKEAIALRYHYGDNPEYIARMLGPEMAEKWGMYAPGDLQKIMREYEYEIEEGSMRRHTPEARADFSQSMLDMFMMPMLQTGSFDTVNNLISEWCKSRNIMNPERFFVHTTVIDGQVVTPEQQRQILAEQQQAAIAEQQGAEQQGVAQEQASNANEVQLQMVETKAQADLAKQQMQNESTEKVTQANLLAKMLSQGQGGG